MLKKGFLMLMGLAWIAGTAVTQAKAPTDGQYVRYDTRTTLNGKARHLVAAVYDPLSGKISTGEVEIPLP
jgi:hypothetical protein